MQYSTITSEFDNAYQALQDTKWITNPADETNQDTGIIRQGELIWFNRDHLECGLVWQQALLSDKTLRYVHRRDFKPISVS